MNFQPHLAALVMSGQKTVTRRRMSHNPRSPWFSGGCGLKVGRDYAVTRGRGKGPAIGRVRETAIDAVQLGDITDLEAEREGFQDSAHFFAAWVAINGAWQPSIMVWRVAFAVCESAPAEEIAA